MTYPTRAFLIAFGAYALSQLDLALFAYAVPAIRKDFNVSLQQMAWVISGGYFIGGILQVWMGHLTDRYGRKRVLMAASAGSGLFVALHGAVPGPFGMAAARAGAIATGGAIYPATGAIVTEEAPARYRGLMAGLLQIAYPFGWFVASLIAAPILVSYGWRAVFLVALLSLPYLLVIHFGLRETARFTAARAAGGTHGSLLDGIRTLLAPEYRRRSLTLFAANLLFVIAYGGSTFLLPTYFTEYRGLPIDMSAYLVGVGNAVSIIGYLSAAWIGEFLLTRRTTVIIFVVLAAIGFLAMLWLPQDFYPTMAVFAVMSIFFYGVSAVKFAYTAELFPTALRATGIAVCGSFAVNLGISLGPLIIAWAVGMVGWQAALSLAVPLPLLASAGMYLFLKPIPSGLEVEAVQERLRTS